MNMHAYNRRSEVAPPKLPKCPSVVEPKLSSCAVVQEGACTCLGQSISHLYCSLQCLGIVRRDIYVKDNDVRYGLKVVHRDPRSSKVVGLQCCGCIAFGREGKVGSKHKAATTVQGWSHPFCYDNIENHLHNQHSDQWALYQALESSFERASFFNDVPVVFENSCRNHAGKTNLVHKAVPTLINANQSFTNLIKPSFDPRLN